MEDPLEEPSEKKPMKKIEAIVVRLFQDENASGPRKPGEEYVHSLLNKDGYVISHEYRREKVSPDDTPQQPCLKIWGVRPPAKKETRPATDGHDEGRPDFPPGASEEEKLFIQIKELQLKSEGMSISIEKQKKDIKALYDSFSFLNENLEARIDFLARTFGSLGNLDNEGSSDDYP